MKQKLLNLIYIFLKYCAKKYIAKHKPKVIGITGSVGKTSARMIIAQVLDQFLPEQRISTSPKNFNSELGLVLSIFEISEYTPKISSLAKCVISIIKKTIFGKTPYDILVLEYGIDTPGDMEYLTSIVTPDFWVFTKLDYVHCEFFKDQEHIGAEKKILLEKTKHKIYLGNNDDYLKNIYSELNGNKQMFPEISHVDYKRKENELKSEFMFEKTHIQSNVLWVENLEYIALACQIFQDMWYELHLDTYHFRIEQQAGRFSILEWINENILIDSTYNAAPASMKKMVENTFEIQKSLFPDYKIFLVLWDMRELWVTSPSKHLELNDSVIYADGIYCIWQEIMPLHEALQVQSFEWPLELFRKANEAWIALKKYLENTDEKYIILFKWSQNTIFTEEVLKAVLKNPADIQKLVRQSPDWLEKKNTFFTK